MAGDPRFFTRTGPHALAIVAAAAGAEPVESSLALSGLMLTGIAPLQTAGPSELSFLDNRRYLPALRTTRAGAVIVHPDLAASVPEGCVALATRQPYMGWAKAAALFFPVPAPVPGIHPTAVIGPEVTIGAGCEIGPHVTIGARAEIGARCRIGPSASIGDGVIGDVPAGQDWVGSPAMPARTFFRQVATLKRLAARATRPADET